MKINQEQLTHLAKHVCCLWTFVAELDGICLSFEVFNSFEKNLSAHLKAVDEVFSFLGQSLALGAQVAHLFSLRLYNLQHFLL